MAKKDKMLNELSNRYREQVGDAALNNKNVTVKDIKIDLSNKFDTMQLCFISDTHIGSSDFDIKGLIENLQYAKSQENAMIFFLGDLMNTAILGSKSDVYEDILNPQEQLDIYSSILKAAKGDENFAKVLRDVNDSGKIAVVHSGNHEDRINKTVGISVSKAAANNAGVSQAHAPFYANIDLVLRQPKAKDGAFHVGIVTHHGTGIKNIDGLFRVLKNVDNADMCVIGHTHQRSMKTDRMIKTNEEGKQVYHDVIMMTLPASGGGTYGASMALPDIHKDSAVWVAVSSEQNPHAGRISPTGITYPEIVPAFAFFNPTNNPNTKVKAKRIHQATAVVQDCFASEGEGLEYRVNDLIEHIRGFEKSTRDKVVERITEKARRVPKGFEDYLKSKQEKEEVIDKDIDYEQIAIEQDGMEDEGRVGGE